MSFPLVRSSVLVFLNVGLGPNASERLLGFFSLLSIGGDHIRLCGVWWRRGGVRVRGCEL